MPVCVAARLINRVCSNQKTQYLGDKIQTSLCDGQYLQCRLRHLGLVFEGEKLAREVSGKLLGYLVLQFG